MLLTESDERYLIQGEKEDMKYKTSKESISMRTGCDDDNSNWMMIDLAIKLLLPSQRQSVYQQHGY